MKLIKQVDSKHVYLHDNGRIQVMTINEEPSKTDGSHQELCCAKSIMAKYIKTGQITHVRKTGTGSYADLSDVEDLHASMITVQKAQDEFASLPGKIRKKFNNDPKQYIKFLQDTKNDPEAVELGLKVWENPDAYKAYKIAKDKANEVHKPDPKPPQDPVPTS